MRTNKNENSYGVDDKEESLSSLEVQQSNL